MVRGEAVYSEAGRMWHRLFYMCDCIMQNLLSVVHNTTFNILKNNWFTWIALDVSHRRPVTTLLTYLDNLIPVEE